MRVAIIYPYCTEARIHTEDVEAPPIGVYYLAATLKAQHIDVDVLNWSGLAGQEDTIRRSLAHLAPDVIGFSVFQANRWGAIDIARMARELLPSVRIVFGGIAATTLWRHFLTNFPEIDAVVLGEGEETFLRLVQWYDEAGAGEVPDHIPGLAYRRDDTPVLTGSPPLLDDLDALPDPSRHYSFRHLLLGRGCPGNCTFCGSPGFWGRRVRFHAPGRFVDQLERLARRGQRFFFISDDTFTLQRDRVSAVCREIRDRRLDIEWAAISRVDTVDEALLKDMRRAGCIQISYGVESGSPAIRRALGKPFSDAQIQRAFDLTARQGILTRAYFIYGCPGETPDTIAATKALIRRIKPLSAIFYIMDIFPGTRLYEDYLARSGVDEDSLWLQRIEDVLYYETDPDLGAEQVLGWGRELRRYFYRALPDFIGSIRLSDDPDMGARHADFYSRLAMTFDHGEYAQIEDIPDKDGMAQSLYTRALSLHPDARSYLGLGIGHQKRGRYLESIRLLAEAVEHFPDNEPLHTCLAVSYMNTGQVPRAVEMLMRFDHVPGVLPHLIACFQSLGDTRAVARYARRLAAVESQT